MADYSTVREQIRLLVDPLILKLRQELFGSGISFGRIITSELPTSTVVVGGNGGTTDPNTLGFLKHITVYSGGTLITNAATELSFLGAGIGSAGVRATIDLATPLSSKLSNPMTAAGDIVYGLSAGVPTRLAIGTEGYTLVVSSGIPKWTNASGLINPMTTTGDIIYANTGGVPTRLGIGAEGRVLTVSGGIPRWLVASGISSSMGTVALEDYICIQDQKTAGTNGGTFTSGAWRTRDLNTKLADTGSYATVASNQVTLAAGSYRAYIKAPANYCGMHKARLRDITNSITLLVGSSEYTTFADTHVTTTSSIIEGRFTLTTSTVLEIQHQCQTTRATDGFGENTNFGEVEIFTVAEFWRESFTALNTGNIISTGAYGSEPASPLAGDLYLPDNSVEIERFSPSGWAYWGPIFPLAGTTNAPTTWINQGSATISTANGGISLYDPTVDASINYRIRKKTAPSTPYTITAAFLAPRISVDFVSCGIGWRQSSDGKLALARSIYIASLGGWVLNSLKASDPTTDVASYISALFIPPALMWLRITDDGTNRIISYSIDSINFIQIHSIGRTDYLTADEVLFYVCTRNVTWPMSMTLLSWLET